jgi:NAD(P)-dependent dehydrogenase (short-subunit alcohol dehydrogenase family)
MNTSRKVVVVTGASRGIGAAIVRAFRELDYAVVATSRSIEPSGDSVLSALTKGGLNAATRSLAIEYARKGIRVNAVALGIIRSPMHVPETHDALGAFNPLGRIGEMSDIADAILFLDSAPFITGEILHVDGGQSAGR